MLRWLLVLLLLTAGCSRKEGPDVSGESHWLMACRDDGECGGENQLHLRDMYAQMLE